MKWKDFVPVGRS